MLELHIPKQEELWFHQKMLSDPATMSYNANWDVSYPGYHRDTGCIDFPESEWAGWHSRMIGNEPEQFYAYIRRKSDGAWIGDVCFHHTPDKDWWDMGIVIYAPYRGRGYATPALRLMLDHAFRVCKISRLHNDFELAREEVSAWQTHFSAGFREVRRENGWLEVMLTREQWLERQANVGFVPAKPDEARELSELRRQVWQTTYRGIYPDEMIDNFDYAFHDERNRQLIQSRNFAVCFILAGTEKIGYLILREKEPVRLQSLYLLGHYRGLGIGTKAFDFVRAHCRDRGIAQFELDCHPDNVGAMAFYGKMGGRITCRDEGHGNNEENGVTFTFNV